MQSKESKEEKSNLNWIWVESDPELINVSDQSRKESESDIDLE